MPALPLLWDKSLAWSSFATATGLASDVPEALTALWRATSDSEAQVAYWRLDNVVVVQGSVYEAARHVIDACVRIAVLGGTLQRRWGMELLLQIAGGWTDPGELERLDADVASECRQRLRRSLEAIYGLLADEDANVRELAAEVIAQVEDRRETFDDRLRWLIDNTTDPSECEFYEGLVVRGLRQ